MNIYVSTSKAVLISILLVVLACTNEKKMELSEDERIDAATAYARKHLTTHELHVGFHSDEGSGNRSTVFVRGRVDNNGNKDLAYVIIKYYYKHIKGSAREGELDLGGVAAKDKKIIKERVGSVTREGSYSSFISIVEADFGEPEA